MNRIVSKFAASAGLVALSLGAMSTTSYAEDSLRFVNNPGGGQIVFGTLGSKPTLPDAMVAILTDVTTHFGEKPKLGRFFQAKGTNSVAVFFSVIDTKQANTPVSGMAVVSLPEGSQPLAGLIYDATDHFRISANPMMAKLNQLLPPPAAPTGGAGKSAPHRAVAAQPLHNVTTGDSSASIGLPAGWQVLPNSGGGAVHVKGPNGEFLNLGQIVQNIYDARNPKAQGMMKYLAMGHNQFTQCPYGGDLVSAYKSVINQVRQAQRMPAMSIQVFNARQVPASKYERATVLMLAELDMHDGLGPMVASIKVGAMPEGPQGQWAMTVGAVGVPERLAEDEWPTMQAIVKSYAQDARVIQQQTDIVIEDIRMQSEAARKRAEIVSQSNDEHNKSIDKTREEQNRVSQGFQNYQFDQAIVKDTETGEHGRMDYKYADALVKGDPNRYEYVPQDKMVKGLDFYSP